MRQRGNILIMTLIACAMLALVLVSGLALFSTQTATNKNTIASLQLEQLHRTSMAESLEGLNAGEIIPAMGEVLLADSPTPGQKRLVKVVGHDDGGRLLTLRSESSLDDGALRKHRWQIVALPKEDRQAFGAERAALFAYSTEAPGDRWLGHHKEEDIVFLCTRGNTVRLADGAALSTALGGSLYVCHLEQKPLKTIIDKDTQIAGAAVFTGDVSLNSNLSCQSAWIDGRLSIGASGQLTCEYVVLGEDVPEEVIEKIEGIIFMPTPPADAEAAPVRDIRSLEEAPGKGVGGTRFLMLGQLD